jgi:hypothetical protein
MSRRSQCRIRDLIILGRQRDDDHIAVAVALVFAKLSNIELRESSGRTKFV